MVLVSPSPSHHLFWQHLYLTLSFSISLHTHCNKIQTFSNLSDRTMVQLQNFDSPHSESVLFALWWSWNSPILVQLWLAMLFQPPNRPQRDSHGRWDGTSMLDSHCGYAMEVAWLTVDEGGVATMLVRWWLWWSEDQKKNGERRHDSSDGSKGATMRFAMVMG